MKTQRLLVILTVINVGLLVFLLAQTRIYIGLRGVHVWTHIDAPVLRGRGLQIVDDQGRIRASINLYPADPARSYPETALFRLIDEEGQPSVKLGTSERDGGLALGANSQGNYVQLSGHGLRVTRDGQSQMIP
jgi:hypothetical protein